MNCPKCGKAIDIREHQNLIFNGQVWCNQCRTYNYELTRLRPPQEIRFWCQRICEAFEENLVAIETFPALIYHDQPIIRVAEVDHCQRILNLYTQGLSLAILCHELAHIFTGQDHTEDWARTFAELIAWVKCQL